MNKDMCVACDDGILNIRVGAIIMKGGKLLMVGNERANYLYTVGGRIKFGETAEAAKRELWEETGASKFHLQPILACRDDKYCGMLYYAEIKQFENIPSESEMTEIKFFEYLPEALTYPDLYKEFFMHVQGWLNIQSNADEMWDVYDEYRNLTGKLHRRGDFLKDGEYHLVVHVWLQNSNGDFLLTKRSPNKGFPNMWELTGGSALAGDDSLSAALREVKEETGLTADPALGKCVISFRRDDNFVDVWLFKLRLWRDICYLCTCQVLRAKSRL